MIFHSYVSLPEGKHCEYLWFFSNLAWIKGCHPAWSNFLNQLLGGHGLLDPNMTSFLVDGSMVYHWFYHMTSLNLRESQPRCQVSAAVVLAAFFTMQRWLYPAGGTMNTGSWHHMGHLFGIQGTDDIHEISAFFGQERVRSNGQK